ncbi:PASTA domain-containing protein [Nonomuraea sp. NPDC050536]|uniref:PASTA domain-containing protein n=1 Tax=Nonomuraea sp. NPDC050536 TaxID=3364366 RepID=UPI0037C6111E
MGELYIPYQGGMDYGVGIDTPSGNKKALAAMGEPNEVQGAAGSILTYSMQLLKTEEDLQTHLGISASASGGVGLFSASARMSFSRDQKIHSSAVFFAVRATLQLAFSSIRNPTPNPAAVALINDGDMDRFRGVFGDMFVRGMQRGGFFVGICRIQTKDSTEQQSLSATVSGGYATFSASGGFSSEFKNALSSKSISINVYAEGGKVATKQPGSLEELQAISQAWPATVREEAVPYSVLLDSHEILNLPRTPNFIDLEHQQDVLVRCARLRNRDWQLLEDIDYILAHQDQFVGVDEAALAKLQADVSDDLDTIAAAASHAVNHPKEASFPDGLKALAPHLPARKAGLPPPPQMVQVPNLIGQNMEAVQTAPEWAWARELFNIVGDRIAVPEPHGRSWVVRQDPPAGVSAPKGSVLTIYVEQGTED